ncbi:MAG: sulfotransferase [Desulfobacteraceae bacterium]|nr:sulfotransferase [Desulfobacteraceae bacterium]
MSLVPPAAGAGPAGDPADRFRVEPWLHYLGGLVSRCPGFWKWLGDRETGLLADRLRAIPIRRPIYVTGLARSGSTLLLEILARHSDTATHRYRDDPLLFIPYLWSRYLERTPRPKARAVERAHGDGILVTPESPEAFEEVLWMAFFPDLHDPRTPAVLDGDTDHPEFETFYRDHIRKLLLVRGGTRYLAKGNYNLTRLGYLRKLFPDARFVIPVREPVWHVASLMRQHRRFCAGQRRHPRARAHLRRVGHFELGLDRRPVNAGDSEEVAHIVELWERGAEVEGWARYWAHLHDHLAGRLAADPQLRSAVLLVRHEEFRRTPAATVAALFAHCGLTPGADLRRETAAMVRPPSLQRPAFFSGEDLATIDRCTSDTAHRLGLGGGVAP